MIEIRPANPSSTRLASVQTDPITCSEAAVRTATNAAVATTIAKQAVAVKVITPQPVTRIASTDVTAAATAASKTLGTTEAPGTARKPAIDANSVAIKFSASPAIAFRRVRSATTEASSA